MPDATVIPLKKPKDAVKERLEADKAFWYEQIRQASAEYMAACWKLAVYKQSQEPPK